MSDDRTEVTVQTTGEFMLLDPTNGKEIPADGSATVPFTSFIRDRLELKQLVEVDADAEAEPVAPAPEPEAPAPTPTKRKA
jgi:hypothetical protein